MLPISRPLAVDKVLTPIDLFGERLPPMCRVRAGVFCHEIGSEYNSVMPLAQRFSWARRSVVRTNVARRAALGSAADLWLRVHRTVFTNRCRSSRRIAARTRDRSNPACCGSGRVPLAEFASEHGA